MYGAGSVLNWTRESLKHRREIEEQEAQAEFEAIEELLTPVEVEEEDEDL